MDLRSIPDKASNPVLCQNTAGGRPAFTATTPNPGLVGQSGSAVSKPLVLVVDDDAAILKLITHNLDMAGYRVLTARDGDQAIRLIRQEKPQLVLLDVLLPGMDGFQVCQSIREFSDIPVMMITARGEPQNVVRGLDMGADDYMAKPFDINVLVARVGAVLTRTRFKQKPERPPLTLGELRIDLSNRSVAVLDREVPLTHTEYRVLCLLARNSGRMITKDYLLTEIWGPEYRGDDHVLQVTVARLRRKIGDYQRNPKYIVTKMGVGYMFRKLEGHEGVRDFALPQVPSEGTFGQSCRVRDDALQSAAT